MGDIELDFAAITIDNCIWKSEGYKLDEGLLKQMVQFKNGPVQIIQTDIVHNEAKKHLAENINKARTAIAQALKTAGKSLKIKKNDIDSATDILSVPGDDAEIAEARLLDYYERIGAKILKSMEFVDFEKLMDMYFTVKAPFEAVKDKKSEFPDAIALISLEAWAEEQGIKIIAVSNDEGWNKFSENSTAIKVVKSLADAIALFQPHNKVNEIVARIREGALLDEENHVLEVINREIADSLDGASVYVEACSNFQYEEDEVYASYVNHELVLDDQGLVDLKVVRIEEEIVVLQISANVTCEVTASFDFSVFDSIDRDYVGMGSNTYTTEETYSTDILISLTGDFTQGFDGLAVTEVEVLETIGTVDFGEVEPDWGDYEE